MSLVEIKRLFPFKNIRIMKNLLENKVSCNLMIWETEAAKRNVNNEVKFLVQSDKEVNVNDVLIGNYSKESVSYYEITEIKDRRPSSMSNKDYLTVRTKWSNKQLDFLEYNTENVSQTFRNLFNII